jgi:hypothetical protein
LTLHFFFNYSFLCKREEEAGTRTGGALKLLVRRHFSRAHAKKAKHKKSVQASL